MGLFERLKKKYNTENKNYKDIISDIMQQRSRDIQVKVAKINQSKFSDIAKDLDIYGYKSPSALQVIPDVKTHVLKSQEKGKLITDTLRNKLSDDLKSVIKNNKNAYLKNGNINPDVIKQFRQKAINTFEGYTKKDKAISIPKNIDTISKLEVRSTLNEIKKEYTNKFQQVNPDIEIKKTWIQNKTMSKKFRFGHSKMNGVTIPFSSQFILPIYDSGENYIGEIACDHPHDSKLPISEIAGCNCDYIITMRRIQ